MDRRRYRLIVLGWIAFWLTGVALFVLAAVGLQMLKKTEWTVQEFTEWYRRYHDSPSRCPVYYAGSDDTHHYFMARPLDSWMRIEIEKRELKLAVELPAFGSLRPGFYYQVDPDRGFAMMPPVERK